MSDVENNDEQVSDDSLNNKPSPKGQDEAQGAPSTGEEDDMGEIDTVKSSAIKPIESETPSRAPEPASYREREE